MTLATIDDWDDNYLQHYGVKGMKWGVRKASEIHSRRRERADTQLAIRANLHPDYAPGQYRKDTRVWGPGAAKETNKRMYKRGESYSEAKSAARKHAIQKTVLATAATAAYVGGSYAVIEIQNNPQLQKTILNGAAEAGRIVFGDAARSNSHGITGLNVAKKTMKGAYKVTTMR